MEKAIIRAPGIEAADMDKLFLELNTDKQGISEKDAVKRLEQFGFNELKETAGVTPLKVFLRQFSNFIVYVLIAAALISFFIGETLNFVVISVILIFIILLGFVQEYKAEKAMDALKKIVQPKTRVLRDGKVRDILTKDVVPGDVLLPEHGDKISADAVVFDSISLKVDESALTGESISVEKKNGDMIFAGTQIVYGKCKAVVTATGMKTKLGEIAGMIQDVEEKTPLQVKIDQLAKTLTIIAFTACALTFILGIIKGASIAGILIIALALAVASVPEGLPLTLTLTLAYGMHNMAKRKAIIRKMLGVEALGSTTVICTDKTGTLTKNEITVEKIFAGDKIFAVSGIGYEPEGEFFVNKNKIDELKEKNLTLLLKAAAICNNAFLEERDGVWQVVGDPTEAALIVAAAKANLWKSDLENEYTRTEEIIFTSERKLMSTLHEKGKGRWVFTKGAPEIVLKKCRFIEKEDGIKELDGDEKAKILAINGGFASSAFRVLGAAYKKVPGSKDIGNIEEDLIFLGLIAMRDPPREEAKESVAVCREAGIKVVMITGDNQGTAKAIAKEINLFGGHKKPDDAGNNKIKKIIEDGIITGSELEELDDKEFESVVEDIVIYARMMPEQKLRIVKALKDKGHVVAMTGDGVNDAPALKKADVGIAMGIKGTDVAKESSVMVLQDDNFATIVEAVRQGRGIYENIEKFTCYLISRNFTEVILILLGIILLGFDFLPLLALQILFINSFDEIMPAIALGLDPVRKGIMHKKPIDAKEKILKKRNLVLIAVIAGFMGAASFIVFILNDPAGDIDRARTLTFAAIVSMALLVPFAFRSLEESILKVGFFTNKLLILGAFSIILLTLTVMYIPFLQEIFKLTTLSLIDWIIPLSVAVATLTFAEVVKVLTRNVS